MTAIQMKRLLERAGISQRAAAKELGIHERTMRKYGAGAAIPKTVQMAITCLCLHQDREIKDERSTHGSSD